MKHSPDYARGYRNGYSAGSHRRWPNISTIPDESYRALAAAAMVLADKVDALFATYCDRETDPIQMEIDAARDAVHIEIERAKTCALGNDDGGGS